MRPAWAVATLLLLLLAGCGGKPAGPAPTAAQGTGALDGIVVSEAIVPLAGVQVALQPGGRNATSDAQGTFAFPGLEPGAYTLVAHLAGWQDTQVTVEVAAGPAGPLVRLVLARDQLAGHYVEAYTFDGLVDESFNVAGSRGNSGDLSSVTYNISARPPDLIQSELVWDSTQSLGDDLDLTAIANAGGPANEDFAEVEGPSPLLLRLNATTIQAAKLGPQVQLDYVVFSGTSQEPAPGAGAGVVLNQRFRLVTHMFYGYLPPDGWRFSNDGEPPPG